MVRNLKVAAAVAAVLAAGSAVASQPTPASAAAPAVSLYISGSSAAQPAIISALETGLCGGSFSVFSSTGDTNFFAVSCTPASGVVTGATGSAIFTVWYRDEGGSVTGALPLVSGSSINQLSLAGASGSGGVYTVAVSGASGTNGIDDSFGGGVSKAQVQLGITDVEPGALIANNYPSAYLQSVYGHATSAQLAGLSATALFDQVFGVFVNTTGGNFSSSETAGQGSATASLSLSTAAIGNVLNGNDTDWSTVSDINGNAVTSNSQPIVIINREQGSGSRTATDIFFTTDSCNKVPQLPILESTGGTADYFSTGNVLAEANLVAGSITYATIDNAGSSKYPNLTLVAINGVQPSNLAAAAGAYGDWFELTAVKNTSVVPLNTTQAALVTYLIGQFQKSPPVAADILGNPNFTGAAQLPISGSSTTSGGKTIYTNPFTRSKVSCADPISVL